MVGAGEKPAHVMAGAVLASAQLLGRPQESYSHGGRPIGSQYMACLEQEKEAGGDATHV